MIQKRIRTCPCPNLTCLFLQLLAMTDLIPKGQSDKILGYILRNRGLNKNTDCGMTCRLFTPSAAPRNTQTHL